MNSKPRWSDLLSDSNEKDSKSSPTTETDFQPVLPKKSKN